MSDWFPIEPIWFDPIFKTIIMWSFTLRYLMGQDLKFLVIVEIIRKTRGPVAIFGSGGRIFLFYFYF